MYRHVFVAGTFDGLHAGHRVVIAKAFEVGQKVTVGVTSDEFVRRYKSGQSGKSSSEHPLKISNFKLKIKSFSERKKVLVAWLREGGYFNRATIIPIDDPYEPAASMADLSALIVTAENRKTGEHINGLRQGLALSALMLIEVPMVAAEDGKPVSSTRMRNGEIDFDGRLVMPESMRPLLGKPLGDVLAGGAIDGSMRRNKDKLIIAVGDVATKTFLDAGITPFLAICDGKVGRKPFQEVVNRLQVEKVSPLQATFVKSGPGFISRKAAEAIRGCFSHSRIHARLPAGQAFTHHAIIVEGEEDLLALPVIVYASVGSRVYYGQPGKGIVEVVVDSAAKKKAKRLLGRFS